MQTDDYAIQLAILAVENVAASIVLTDPVGVLLYVNPMFERLTGYTLQESGGRPCSFLQSNAQGFREEQAESRLLREAMMAGKNATVRLYNYRKSGERFLNEVTISPLHDDRGDVIGFVGTQRDVTAQVRLDDEARQTGVRHSTMDLLDEILGDFSHELRHPLSRIGVSSHLIRRMHERGDSGQVGEVTHTIEHEIGLIRGMLDRFGHLQRLYVRKPMLSKRVSLASVMVAQISMCRANHPDVHIVGYVEPQIPELFLDIDEISIMIRELLDNMLIHNDHPEKYIAVSVTHEHGNVVLRFTNNGSPISDADVPYLFRPFLRGDRARTADATRVGLGLSLVARIAQVHGGRVYLAENSKTSIVFTVEMPIEAATVEVPAVRLPSRSAETITQEIERILAMTGSERSRLD